MENMILTKHKRDDQQRHQTAHYNAHDCPSIVQDAMAVLDALGAVDAQITAAVMKSLRQSCSAPVQMAVCLQPMM